MQTVKRFVANWGSVLFRKYVRKLGSLPLWPRNIAAILIDFLLLDSALSSGIIRWFSATCTAFS